MILLNFDIVIFMVFVGCLNEEELGVKVLSLKRILDKYMMLLLY